MNVLRMGNLSYGDSTKVYLSLPDTSTTCSSYTLPALPPGYSYSCQTSANYQKPDGTGWIPIAFLEDDGSPIISSLPIDPVNSPPYYYSYFPGGSYELAALLSEVRPQSINDNG